jgi:hypothetical protein
MPLDHRTRHRRDESGQECPSLHAGRGLGPGRARRPPGRGFAARGGLLTASPSALGAKTSWPLAGATSSAAWSSPPPCSMLWVPTKLACRGGGLLHHAVVVQIEGPATACARMPEPTPASRHPRPGARLAAARDTGRDRVASPEHPRACRFHPLFVGGHCFVATGKRGLRRLPSVVSLGLQAAAKLVFSSCFVS